MKWHYTFIFALLFFGILNSCKKPQQVSSTFNENIKIRMSETIDSTKRTLQLNCYTERILECANYRIQATHTLTNNKIAVNFIQIVNPRICLTSLGRASILISIDKLSNKDYELELNFPSIKIAGELNVSTGSFRATLPLRTKVQFINPDFNRIPDNTIYGTVHYHTASTGLTVQKFIDSLQFFGAMLTLYSPGNYGQFEIESNGRIKQIQDTGYYFTRYFIFNYPNNDRQLKSLVRRFGVNYPDSLLITLNTTRGETFYSWTQ